MKSGLILEGGAMRGMFTAGVLDVFMENNIVVDGAIGVSAGAVFGCNYKSHQIGRAIRYNKRFCGDKRYVSYMHWLKTGDLYPIEFCYDLLPNKLDVFDAEAYKTNPMEFYVVATDANTGKPVYHKCMNGDGDDIQWMRASASMPVFSNMVPIDGLELSDGGTSDSIPLKYFEGLGYDRNIVILTQPQEYVKKPYPAMWYIKRRLKKYPNLYKALEVRHIFYNETIKYISESEKAGKILVIRPDEALKIKPAEKNPEELERVYQMGRRVGEKKLKEVIDFLK